MPGLGSLAAAVALTLLPPPAPEWQDLFNGKTLDGWTVEAHPRPAADGLPRWIVLPDGKICCEAGEDAYGFLRYTRRQFGDFTLRLEYRFLDRKSVV